MSAWCSGAAPSAERRSVEQRERAKLIAGAVNAGGHRRCRPGPRPAQLGLTGINTFRVHSTAIADVLPAATLVIDHCHAIRLASDAVNDVRRWVQQDQLVYRGHKADPLYGSRRLLLVTSAWTISSCRWWPKGLTIGEVQAHLAGVYGAEVSGDTIGRITDRVLETMADSQHRPLDRVYPVVFIDAIMVKIRDGQVTNRPIYTAIGVTVDGERDILGLWAAGREGAKYS